MADIRLNRHGSREAHRLFDEDTAQIGALGDIVEKHGGDSLNLRPEPSVGGADAGESDLAAEMLPMDPSAEWESLDDEYPGENEEDPEGIGEADITGTAAGIAPGFGTHLSQDLGADGFQIEEMPVEASAPMRRRPGSGELDDYDEGKDDGQFDLGDLAGVSEPGQSPAAERIQPREIPDRPRRAVTFDEDLDEAEREK